MQWEKRETEEIVVIPAIRMSSTEWQELKKEIADAIGPDILQADERVALARLWGLVQYE